MSEVEVGSFWRARSCRTHLVVRVVAAYGCAVVYQNYYGKFDEFFSCQLDRFVSDFDRFDLF